MAKAKPLSETERNEIVDYALEHSVDEAIEKYATNRKTLRGWISKAGRSTDLDENRQKAMEAARTENELRWERIINKMGIEAEACLDDMRAEFTKTVVDQRGEEHDITRLPEPADRAKLATAFGILFDKRQLATGGSTSNTRVENPLEIELIKAQNQKNAQEREKMLKDSMAGQD